MPPLLYKNADSPSAEDNKKRIIQSPEECIKVSEKFVIY